MQTRKRVTNLERLLSKEAGAGTEFIASLAPSAAVTAAGVAGEALQPGAGIALYAGSRLGDGIAGIYGLAGAGDDADPLAALRHMEDTPEMSLIPTNQAYRASRRARLVAKALNGKSKYLHEALSNLNLLNLLGAPAGALLAALTPTRTLEEQIAEESDSPVKDWLIPGVGTYNYFKRLGVSNMLGDSDAGGEIERKLKHLRNANKK